MMTMTLSPLGCCTIWVPHINNNQQKKGGRQVGKITLRKYEVSKKQW
jgi:hypothetical protein